MQDVSVQELQLVCQVKYDDWYRQINATKTLGWRPYANIVFDALMSIRALMTARSEGAKREGQRSSGTHYGHVSEYRRTRNCLKSSTTCLRKAVWSAKLSTTTRTVKLPVDACFDGSLVVSLVFRVDYWTCKTGDHPSQVLSCSDILPYFAELGGLRVWLPKLIVG